MSHSLGGPGIFLRSARPGAGPYDEAVREVS